MIFIIIILIILTIWYYADKSYKLNEDEKQIKRAEKTKIEFYNRIHNTTEQTTDSSTTKPN
jgi:septation ring formation regulator EzrA